MGATTIFKIAEKVINRGLQVKIQVEVLKDKPLQVQRYEEAIE